MTNGPWYTISVEMTYSLRWKLLIPLVVTGLVVGLAGSWFVKTTYQQQLDEHMQRRGESIARALDTMIRSTVFAEVSPDSKAHMLGRIVTELGELPDVTLIVVVSDDPPRVVASTEPAWRGVMMESLPYERVQEDLFDAIETRRMHPHFHWETLEYDVSWPLALQIEDRPHGEPVDGAIMLHLDARPVRAQLRIAAVETIIALLGAILSIGLVAWLVMNRLVLARLSRVQQAMNQRTAGASSVYAPAMGHDEIGLLSQRFNAMLQQLDQADAEVRAARDNLEEQVEERTRELKESHAILRESDRLATVGTFAAGVAHDLNNLLLPIRSGLHVLDRIAPDDAADCLSEMHQSVRFLQQLAASMRLCSLDPADLDASHGETDIAAWWSEVSALLTRAFRSRLEGRGELTYDIEPGLPVVGVATHHLTQAVLNLLINAGDACEGTDDVRVDLSAGASDSDGFVRLSVRDNGQGMSEEVVQRAFDPFFTTKKRGASSGLGLAMVRSITESVGGQVWLESRIGEGTTITLELPTLRTDRADSAAEGAPRVAVSVRDERLAAHLISSLRHEAHVARTDPGAPPEADVWVIDADPANRALAERFLEACPNARVALIAHESRGDIEGWPSSNVVRLPVSFSEKELLAIVRDRARRTRE